VPSGDRCSGGAGRRCGPAMFKAPIGGHHPVSMTSSRSTPAELRRGRGVRTRAAPDRTLLALDATGPAVPDLLLRGRQRILNVIGARRTDSSVRDRDSEVDTRFPGRGTTATPQTRVDVQRRLQDRILGTQQNLDVCAVVLGEEACLSLQRDAGYPPARGARRHRDISGSLAVSGHRARIVGPGPRARPVLTRKPISDRGSEVGESCRRTKAWRGDGGARPLRTSASGGYRTRRSDGIRMSAAARAKDAAATLSGAQSTVE
jgi:hypothetical protein